jgi:hypothetical protein
VYHGQPNIAHLSENRFVDAHARFYFSDFKSFASADFATRARGNWLGVRGGLTVF